MILDRHHISLYLIIAAGLLVVSWLWADYVSHQANLAAAVSEARAQAADKLNAQTQAQSTQQLQLLAQQNVLLQGQITALAQAVAARNLALAAQKKADTTLPPSELAARWNLLIKVPSAAKPIATGFEVTPEGAVATVQGLDELLALRGDKQDMSSIIDRLNGTVANNTTALAVEKSAHTSDQATCKLDLQARDDRITALKADVKKARKTWGIIGLIVGAIGRRLLGG